MPEAWRDDNENDTYDSGELFIDSNSDGVHSSENGLFNGPQCQGDNCASSPFVTIRKSVVLITASSNAYYRITNADSSEVLASNFDNTATGASISVPRGDSVRLNFEVSDTAFQTMPFQTNINVSSSVGDLLGGADIEVANTRGTNDPDGFGGNSFQLTLSNNLSADATESEIGDISLSIVSPDNVTTGTSIVVTLE